MKEVYSSKYLTILIDEEKKYIEIIRLKATQMMHNEEYKSDVQQWLKIIEEYRPEYQLVDDRKMYFIITPNMQEWANKNLIEPAVKVSLKRVAFLKSKELFSNISIEQTMSEHRDHDLSYKYFDDKEKALEWLFKE